MIACCPWDTVTHCTRLSNIPSFWSITYINVEISRRSQLLFRVIILVRAHFDVLRRCALDRWTHLDHSYPQVKTASRSQCNVPRTRCNFTHFFSLAGTQEHLTCSPCFTVDLIWGLRLIRVPWINTVWDVWSAFRFTAHKKVEYSHPTNTKIRGKAL